MGRLAATKLQREEEEKNPPKPVKPTYPGFAETGIDEQTWQKQIDEAWDERSGASKLWDTINIADSGRSWGNKNVKENKSAGESIKDVAKSIFSGTEKVYDSVEQLTGMTDRRQKKRDEDRQKKIDEINEKYKDVPDGDPRLKEMYAEKKKVNDQYQKELEGEIKDTEWVGDGIKKDKDGKPMRDEKGQFVLDKGWSKDRFKKAAGVSIEAVSEWIPVGKGANASLKASRLATKAGGQGLSRMAKAKLAAEIAGKSSLISGIGGAAGAASEEGTDLRDIAIRGLTGMASGAVLGGAGTYLPDVAAKVRLPKDQGGFVKNPFYKARIGEDLANEISLGKIDGNIVSHKADDLRLGTDTISDALDRNTVDSYKAKLKAGEELDPIIVQIAPDGRPYIQDGAHRYTAARELGITEIPTVAKKNNVVMAAKVEPPTEASLTAQVVRKDPVDVDNMKLSEISDAAKKRPQAELQKAIEDAHNAGDNAKVEQLIMELPVDEQPSMRSAMGLPPQEPKVQLKVLDEVQREADARTPGGTGQVASQATATRTQQGAQFLVDDIDRLQKEVGIDLQPLDRKAAAALTGEVRRSGFQEFKDKMGKNFQDTLTYAAKSLGKPGTDFAHAMLAGNKFKRDALEALREPMAELSKLNKKLAGDSLTARRDLGSRIGAALDDRANAAQFLKNKDEQALFDNYVKVFDYVKMLREKSGLETLENYRPWVAMKEASEPPTWLAENVTNKRTQTLSRFSKERVRTDPADNVDDNLADMIYGYVNSQLNEMAYDAPVKMFKKNLQTLPAGNKANVGLMNEGIDYMRELVEQAVNPQRKNPVERFAGKLTSNVYGAVLPFNLRLAIQNKSQQFVANSRVSKGARRLVKQLDPADAKELEKGLVFGDSTVYGQLEDVNPTPTGKGKGIIEKAKKVDPYQRSEKGNVITSYQKGAMQAVLESDTYKAAKSQGMKTKEAIHVALQDPATREAAIRRGNVLVNDTQFGASPLARPEMLREEGSLWGVLPKKTIYMFTRFPIGMSQHALEVLDNKSTRALEMLKNGDPRTVPIAEMRTNFRALLDSMQDADKALKKGVDVGIPQEVLTKQIATVKSNLDIIDNAVKKKSQIRGGKTVKNLAKMWAAAAAIQIIFDGGIQSFSEDPAGTTMEAVNKTNPTMGNRVVGEYSPLAAITSSASPIDRYGNLNERAILNYIPGVGLAANRARDVKKLFESFTGEGEE